MLSIKKNIKEISKEGGRKLADLIQAKPNCVLGLASGSTPLGIYRELIRIYKEGKLNFSKVTTFNIDEYVGLHPTNTRSYRYFMWENLFRHLNINPNNIHFPKGITEDFEEFCINYEKKIKESGGIDLQLLGIGTNGHIGFNEPGSLIDSRTRIVRLSERTVLDNSRFFQKKEDVPKYAVTLGIGTIMEAKEILLVASGFKKAEAIKAAIEGPVSPECPAAIVQVHPNASVLINRKAASKLEKRHLAPHYI